MTNPSLGCVLHHLRQAAAPSAEQRSDSELLHAFVSRRDEASFAALVRRHAALVLRVCRHVLGHEQDAEDAFQATFLVLARKAPSIHKQASLASFLHGVAYRLSLRAKRDAARRRLHESHAPVRTGGDNAADLAWREVQALVEEELTRLPEKYRSPFILCHLQGLGRAEAAHVLGVKEGTVWSRLTQARRCLQTRLARRGVVLSAALAALTLSDESCRASAHRLAAAAARLARGASTSARVAALAQAGWQPLAASKLKLALTGLVILLTMAGAGGAIRQTLTPDQAPPAAAPAKEPDAPKAEETRDDCRGDPLPPGAIARLGTIRFRHGYHVVSVAFSLDGKTVAAGGAGRAVTLWDAANGKEKGQLLNSLREVRGIAFSPDGKMLAAIGPGDAVIYLVDTSTGAELRRLQEQSGIHCVAFAPNCKYLATGSVGGVVRLWDPATGAERLHRSGDCGRIHAVAFSPDSKLLAYAGEDGTIRLWNGSFADEPRRLEGHAKDVSSLSFSPDGQHLVSAGQDGTIRLWTVTTGRQLRTLGDKREAPIAVTFSRDGELLASSHRDGTLALWDPRTGRKLRGWPAHASPAATVAFSPDGKTLASGGAWESGVRLWNVADGKELHAADAPHGPVEYLRWSADGQTLLSAGRERRVVWWDLKTGAPRRQVYSPAPDWTAFTLAADGKTLAMSCLMDRTVRVGDLNSDRPPRVLGEQDVLVRAIGFSPDGRLLATGGRDTPIHLWDVMEGKKSRTLGEAGDMVGCLTFSPDGKSLAYGRSRIGNEADTKTLRLMDVATGKELHSFDSGGYVSAVCFSPDGATLAAWHDMPDKHLVRLWDVATGRELCRYAGHQASGWALAFSPDGKLIASGGGDVQRRDNAVHLWEAATGKLIRRFDGHHSGVSSLAFSPDGCKLASGGGDATILIWDATVRPRQPVRTEKELEAYWETLAGEDAARAYEAVCTLAAAAEQAVPLLEKHLHPVPRPGAPAVARLIADLNSDDFAVRQKAEEELGKLGEAAVAPLRKALADKPALEVRRRLQQLIDQAQARGGDWLRLLRVVQVLERMHTPPARRLLESLAAGAPGVSVTEDAKAALRRLASHRGQSND
jgi:RNA polymerase sigma factor (sigma-70 family)